MANGNNPITPLTSQTASQPAAAGAGFSYKNGRGVTYYLHEKQMPKVTLRFFSKVPEGAIPLPSGYDVMENPKTGLPFIKKKA